MAIPNLKLELVLILLFSISLALFLWSGLTLKHYARFKSAQSNMMAYEDIDAYGGKINRTECITKEKAPKLLCWIMTVDSEEGHEKSTACLETWAKRCDKVLLVQNGTRLKERNGVLTVPIKHESRYHLWHKVISAFSYLYDHHLDEYDWFMKADDDTYVIVERMKQFLLKHSNMEPIYFGHKFKPYVKQGYMSGGSGYVLSRQALKLLVEKSFEEELRACDLGDAENEDVLIGLCLEAAGVKAGDTRDAKGRPTFLALSPLDLLSQSKIDNQFWYTNYTFYGPPKPGKDCCSDEPVSFHYIAPHLMRLIDWLLYDVKRLNAGNQVQDTNILCSTQPHNRKLMMK